LDFSKFKQFNFTDSKSIVYIIGVEENNHFHPFYVGQSDRSVGRFGDYLSAQFSAPTDFKVGQAIKTLTQKKLKVIVKYRYTNNRRIEEAEFIKILDPILNKVPGYDYKKKQEIRKK
jgi:hypothetical protein